MKAESEAAAAAYEAALAEARAGGAKIADAARSRARGAADAKRSQIEASRDYIFHEAGVTPNLFPH